MKTIWVIGGGFESIPGIIIAKQLGLTVVVSDGNPKAPGNNHADFSYCASTYDLELTKFFAKLHVSKGNKIDGVISFAADVPRTIAGLASYFNLPSQSMKTANFASDKYLMKEQLRIAGVNVPRFSRVESAADIKKFVASVPGRSVLKPTDSRGSRGVLVIDKDTDMDWAYRDSLSFSPSKQLIIEEFLSGPQFSTESVVADSKWLHLGFADRNYQELERLLPRIIENGGSQPSVYPKEIQEAIFKEIEKSGVALGLTLGILKGDMVWHRGQPYVIEVATRLSGGWFSSVQIPASTGVSIVKLAIRIAIGEKINIETIKIKRRKSVAIRYLFPVPNMKYRSLTENLPKLGRGIIEAKYIQDSDYKNTEVKSHTDRLAFVIAGGRSVAAAIKRAERAIAKIDRTARIAGIRE